MRCSATTQSPGRHSFMSLACSSAACRISSVVSLSEALQAEVLHFNCERSWIWLPEALQAKRVAFQGPLSPPSPDPPEP